MLQVLPPPLEKGLGDHRLRGIEWLSDGRDLRLSFSPPGSRDGEATSLVRLRLVWVSELRVRLEFGDYGDEPLVFGASFGATSGGWSVAISFDGAPDGAIEARCNSVEVE